MMLDLAYERIGDTKASELERGIALLLLEGIESTGDGTEAHPYLISRVVDEYDLLTYLGKVPEMQSLVESGERLLDRHNCEDGTSIYFDVTAQHAFLCAAMVPEPAPRKRWFWQR